MMIKFNIVYNTTTECQRTFSVTYLSCRTLLLIKNFNNLVNTIIYNDYLYEQQ